MNEERARPVRAGSNVARGVAWLGLLIFVVLASGWAMLWVTCAFEGGYGGSKPKGTEFALLLAVGIVPLLLALGAVVTLWRVQGPPFSRSQLKP